MKNIEQKLLPIVRRWSGNIPVWAAREAGIESSALRHWAASNPDVGNAERGVYTWFCDDDEIDWALCSPARVMAYAGRDAILWGPSALELLEIGDVGQPVYFISVPKRRRPKEFIKWVVTPHRKAMEFKGLKVQPLKEALVTSMPFLDSVKRESVLSDVLNRFPDVREEAEQIGVKYGLL